MDPHRPWELRLDRVINLLRWATFALGVFLSFLSRGPDSRVLLAAFLAGIYVIGSQALPRALFRHRWLGELLAVGGVALTAAAVGLSGGLTSPYLLLALMPPLFAAAFWGLQVGLETAALGAGALAAVVMGMHPAQSIAQAVAWASLHFLVADPFGYARRLLLEEGGTRSEELQARVERLEAAHSLLTRLSEMADVTEFNPVTVGELALDNLSALLPFETATVAISGSEGPVVVARRVNSEQAEGSPSGTRERLFLPLQMGDREVGFVVLARPLPFSDRERELMDDLLRPVSLAFANVLLLQDMARRAVREERARLARDLHDEIGPSLASLGLALDLALVGGSLDPALASHLTSLRGSVTDVVEEVRTVVADLREPDHPSITEHLRRLMAEVPENGPEVVAGLEERRPPRPAVVPELTAILSEAFRNVLRHAEARHLIVDGWVDRDRGLLRIGDDGKGFDPATVPADRFGLTGIRERAALIGVRLTIHSEPGEGTLVEVSW